MEVKGDCEGVERCLEHVVGVWWLPEFHQPESELAVSGFLIYTLKTRTELKGEDE